MIDYRLQRLGFAVRAKKIDITQVDTGDPHVWEMISEGRVKGVFQIEGHLGKTWSKKLKPESIEELAALLSIIRPGCLKAFVDGKSMTQHFVDRKFGKEEIPSLHESIDDLLKETYGVIVYQEQAMKIAEVMAGFSLQAADDLRTAIGKKKIDLMKKVRVKYIEGCKQNGIDEDTAVEIFDMIEKSARYSFNKSHAVGYAKMAYWSAWLRCYYPSYFFKNWLGGASDKIDPDMEIRQLVMSAKSEDIDICGPSFKVLDENFSWFEGAIHFGICNVKNVGKAHLLALRKILNGSEMLFRSFFKPISWSIMLIKTLRKINKRAVENLIKTGAFSGLGKSRTAMLHEYHCFMELTKKEMQAVEEHISLECDISDIIKKLITYGTKKDGGFISTQNRLDKVESILSRLENPGRDLSDNSVVYAKLEERLLGYAISHSELNNCSDAGFADTTCKEIADGKMGSSTIAVIVKNIREHETKNCDTMAFLSVEDDSGESENIVIFPDVYGQYKDIIYNEATLLISGEIKDKERNSFIVDKVFVI
ncbi:MAG: hypothetical protein NWE83_04345 [Candidatus Bathyarchaeota archaeon]|nr:hypothetical protein [Candidatus Bathyarchaeota archaeon]